MASAAWLTRWTSIWCDDSGIEDLEAAREVAARLSSERIDFLMLQAAACASGELLEPLAQVAPRLGCGRLRSRSWKARSSSTPWSRSTITRRSSAAT